MGRRKVILATNEIYHVYNRGVEKRPIFLKHKNYERFIEIMNYYRFTNCLIRFSYFKKLSSEEKVQILKDLETKSEKLVEIYAFCLMPNHFHLQLKQLSSKGISTFMAKVTNSYSHYFNTLNERIGHLLQGNFSAVRIEDNEQFLHLNRYIHLNPVTSYLMDFKDLETYKYSSYFQYIQKTSGLCNTEKILSYFNNVDKYKKFTEDQVDYARKLDNIKHLLLE